MGRPARTAQRVVTISEAFKIAANPGSRIKRHSMAAGRSASREAVKLCEALKRMKLG
jgi:hypothetical protein